MGLITINLYFFSDGGHSHGTGEPWQVKNIFKNRNILLSWLWPLSLSTTLFQLPFTVFLFNQGSLGSKEHGIEGIFLRLVNLTNFLSFLGHGDDFGNICIAFFSCEKVRLHIKSNTIYTVQCLAHIWRVDKKQIFEVYRAIDNKCIKPKLFYIMVPVTSLVVFASQTVKTIACLFVAIYLSFACDFECTLFKRIPEL